MGSRIRFSFIMLFFFTVVLFAEEALGLELLVASSGTNSVKRFDGLSGIFVDDFVASNSGGLSSPRGMVFGPDGNLYVTGYLSNAVHRYDGSTGIFIDRFAEMRRPFYMTFTPVIPEPSTFAIWSLLGLSCIGVGWWRKRRAA